MNIKNIRHIKEIEKIKYLKDEFVIMNSAVMCLFELKNDNKDIDLLVTKNFPQNLKFNNVSINTWKRWEHRLKSFALSASDFIDTCSFEYCEYNFCKIDILYEILKIRKNQKSGGKKIENYLEIVKNYIAKK